MPPTPAVRGLHAPRFLINHWVPLVKVPVPAFCESVTDADTLQCWARVPLKNDPAYPTIRVAVIDAPETQIHRAKGGALEVELGLKAAAWARSVLEGQQIALVPTSALKDDTDRWICAVIYRTARVQYDYGTELGRRRFLKSDVPAYIAATPEERAAWGAAVR